MIGRDRCSPLQGKLLRLNFAEALAENESGPVSAVGRIGGDDVGRAGTLSHRDMTDHFRPERDGRETPKQSFDFKKRAFDSLSIPGAYLSLATYLHARITSMSERLPVRMRRVRCAREPTLQCL
ncbi:MAG: hypothetical protein JWO52_2611 [Gammaproteobacteria bacterium]|nr:hypothetical protein [Gammaproteobacteria bacterium]